MAPELHTALSLDPASTLPIGAAHELETRVRLIDKTAEADGIVSLRFEDVTGVDLPQWRPGAHVDVVVSDVAERQYSLCGDPADRSGYRIGVLRDEGGRGSSLYLHDRLRVGDELVLRGPRNNFQFAAASRYRFVAGGIGITPILVMVRAAEAAGAEWSLLYGGRRRSSMAFLDELEPFAGRVEVRPEDEYGLLDLAGFLGQPAAGTLVYCCGPEPLLQAVESLAAKWPPKTLRLERFSPKALTGPQRAETFEVELAKSGIILTIPPDQSILEVVREARVPVLSSCTEGTCGTCEQSVLDGTPDHRDSVLDDDEREEGDCMMICVSRSLTPRLVLDL